MSTSPPLLPFLLIVVSFLTYHLITKSVSTGVNPLFFLILVYAVSLGITGVLWRSGMTSGRDHLTRRDGALALLLGLSLVGIEVGFIWAYRRGWPVNRTAMMANIATTALLIPVGYILFRERLGVREMSGIALAIGGMWLLSGR